MSPIEAQPSTTYKLVRGGAALSAAAMLVVSAADLVGDYMSVAVGSALGGLARHWCSIVSARWLGEAFPWGTLFINALGSLVIGCFFAIAGPDGRFAAPVSARLFVMTGICGGYTTFSAFSLQSLSLFRSGAWFRGGAYVVASVALCLAAVWIGYALGGTIARAYE